MTPPTPTQQQFDLSTFRKKVNERLEAAKKRQAKAARSGWGGLEDFAHADGSAEELEGVLALLGEGEPS